MQQPEVLMYITIIVIVLITLIYLTDPFNRYTIVKLPFQFKLTKTTQQIIDKNHKLTIHQGLPYRLFALMKSGWHILHTRYISSPKSAGLTLDEIISDIHERRFDPSKLLVISGDHFNSLFVRNLGVFYYPLLDTASPLNASAADWSNRQSSYLQTLAYALGVFQKHPVPSTTIVPTGTFGATLIDFHAYPSDTVYGILFALAVLSGQQSPNPYLPAASQTLPLQTKPAAKLLLKTYRETLQALYAHYRETVFDDQTGLVKTSVHLSGAKDITRRTCAFYDNVIFWKTLRLARQLGVAEDSEIDLDALKQRILKTFWLEKEGYFLEDLSPAGRQHRYYSSDWLVTLFTGFLDPRNPSEQAYYSRSIEYIQKQRIDYPLALKYQHETRAARQFPIVRFAVASYGGDSIWSFWGMEYIKALALLYEATGEQNYLATATHHLKQYEQKILKYGGFPELYDAQGDMLQTPLYRSVRQTGWVVGFEQAKGLVEAVTKKMGALPK